MPSRTVAHVRLSIDRHRSTRMDFSDNKVRRRARDGRADIGARTFARLCIAMNSHLREEIGPRGSDSTVK
jgi:hypothetical protein